MNQSMNERLKNERLIDRLIDWMKMQIRFDSIELIAWFCNLSRKIDRLID